MEIVPENIHTTLNTSETPEWTPTKTFCVKNLQTACSKFQNFGVYEGTVENHGNEIYSIIDKGLNNKSCAALPIDLEIYQGQELAAKMEMVNTNFCCKKTTEHRLFMYTSAGEIPLCDLNVQLSKCGNPLTIQANPYFTSSPVTMKKFALLIITIFSVCIPLMLSSLYVTEHWFIAIIVQSVVLSVFIALTIYYFVTRGCKCSNHKWKMLDLYNINDNRHSVRIYKYYYFCCKNCRQGDYEIECMGDMNVPQILTLLSITIHLHCIISGNKRQELF